MVPSTLSAETQGGSQATHANLSLEMKGQLLDIVQLQSNMQIFTAKYPKANVVCGIQVDGSSDLQWQCYGPDASKQEIHRALVDFINEEYRWASAVWRLPLVGLTGCTTLDWCLGAGWRLHPTQHEVQIEVP